VIGVDDRVCHCVDRHIVRVNHERILVELEWRCRARGIVGVSPLELAANLFEGDAGVDTLQIGTAAPRAFVDSGIEVHLQTRLRNDDGGDVPSDHDDGSPICDRTLHRQQGGAHRRMRGNLRYPTIHLRGSELFGNVFSIEQHSARLGDVDGEIVRELG
jgi:hypothetical protein